MVVIILWLPIAAVLALVFHPTLSPTWLDAGVFFVAIWGAYLIRSLFLWLLGLIAFWLIFSYTKRLDGRLRYGLTFLVPVAFAVTIPAEALTGRLTVPNLLLACGFTIVLLAITRVFWRLGLGRYSGASA